MVLPRVMTLGRINPVHAKDLVSLGTENIDGYSMASARWYLSKLPFYLGNRSGEHSPAWSDQAWQQGMGPGILAEDKYSTSCYSLPVAHINTLEPAN